VSTLFVASIALFLLLVAYLLLLMSFLVGLWRARGIARSRAVTEQAVQAMGTWLVVVVTSREPQRADQARATIRDRLAELKAEEQQMTLFTLAHNVGGEGITVLREISEELGILDRVESEATSGRWSRRLLAVRLMASLNVRSPRIRQHLDDPHPAVRAQCAQWATADPTEANMSRLAEMVEDPHGRCRFEAQDALARLGVTASGTVLGLLRSEHPRQVEAGLRIAALTSDPGYTETLHSFLMTGTPRQQLLAAASLSTADEPALHALHRLVCHDDPVIRQKAIEILAEDRDWHQTTAIAPLLSDPSRTVRRAAGLALLRLGAPGMIILRQRAAAETRPPDRAETSGNRPDELAGSQQ
jgi:HEAT repeat protein